MLRSPYSRPEFNPYGDDSSEPEVSGPWNAPSAAGPLDASLCLPGSKSLTNRELVLSALATEPSTLRAPLHSRDTNLMVEALRSLGTTIVEQPGDSPFGGDWIVTPGELTGSTTIDCGLAGTVMRFLPPVAALALGPTTFDGDAAARKRPMNVTVTSLRDLGVDVADEGRGALPFTVHGAGRVSGGELTVDASRSSQFVSGLLLAAARFENGLDLTHAGERLPSLPHIEMTIETLAQRGVAVTSDRPGHWRVAPGVLSGRVVDIEPDLSNAGPFLIAALVAGGSVTITGWPEATTQVGNDLLEILPLFGAAVTRTGASVTVSATGAISAVSLDLSTGGELAPALVALAVLADGTSEITGIGHIRHHETDRLAALVAEINGLGGRATELPDGIRVEPATLRGGLWHTYEDHRMATAGAIIGLRVAGVDIEDIRTT
ncbi:MAG: 3-phosphoshikimate 1-carboxyvinyltransferase, partial [Aurantimicrobium sp.]|nr:3-phosphoshikimate 1-carboxyvinyltransferase [Aurantimicrobium sp.]